MTLSFGSHKFVHLLERVWGWRHQWLILNQCVFVPYYIGEFVQEQFILLKTFLLFCQGHCWLQFPVPWDMFPNLGRFPSASVLVSSTDTYQIYILYLYITNTCCYSPCKAGGLSRAVPEHCAVFRPWHWSDSTQVTGVCSFSWAHCIVYGHLSQNGLFLGNIPGKERGFIPRGFVFEVIPPPPRAPSMGWVGFCCGCPGLAQRHCQCQWWWAGLSLQSQGVILGQDSLRRGCCTSVLPLSLLQHSWGDLKADYDLTGWKSPALEIKSLCYSPQVQASLLEP